MDLATPSSLFDPIAAHNSLQLIKTVLDQCDDYSQLIEHATNTELLVQQYQLIALLDHRAYAFGMKGQFAKAVKDAETMISYGPTTAAGHLRLVSLLDMQGKHLKATEACQAAMETISPDDPAYNQFLQCKTRAMERNDIRLDIIAALAAKDDTENTHAIIDNIIARVPDKERSICLLDVSGTWHRNLVGCQSAWNFISNKGSENDTTVARVLPYIAEHVKNLTISTSNTSVLLHYLDCMDTGRFKNVQSLKMTRETTGLMNANMHMLYTSALWQLQNTLTCLELFFASCNTEISLSSLLFYCPNIEKLVFSARSATLASLIGDLELMGGSHRALVDLDLDTGIATGEALEAILKRCPKLRRLSVFGCEPSVLDVIHEGRCCPDLVIFGYSPSFEIVQLNELEDESVGPGLRALYTPNGGTGAPADKLLPLLKKHAKTLQRVYANMEEESQDYDNNPSLFEEPLGFERLMKLTYWPEEHIETLFLRSLGSSLGSVTFFSPTCSSNIPAFTDVMLKLTSLQDMEIARASSEEGEDHAASQLVQMCKTYAALPESQQTMRMLRFWYCSCLNDDVLSAMTELKTLTTIELAGESRVTTQGLVRFFKRMNKAATVKKVCLQDIDAVDDCVLNAIASMSHLETLEMDDMSTVTDIGLQDVIDSVKTLRNLKLEGCDTFSEEALLYARSKIKHFEKC